MNLKRYEETLQALSQVYNLRKLPENYDNKLINLSSNDYLGLNANEKLREEFYEKFDTKKLLMCSESSRLLSVHYNEIDALEKTISKAYQKPACLVFNSGHNANLGILPALCEKNDLIIADKLVHASIIDGIMLSKAKFERYNHLDYLHLEKILEKNYQNYENIFVVTESIYSMDGDTANLQYLCELKKKFNFFLYLDEAHAIGVRGKNGLGCAEEEDCIENIDFIVGTFGKSIASLGAFLVCDEVFKSFLVNRSRSLIYTTSLPPLNLVWTKFIFEKLPDLQHLRTKIEDLINQFSKKIKTKSQSNILPYIIGSNEDAINISQQLKQYGFNAFPIKHPTVPVGTARLRISICANHQLTDLLYLADVLIKLKNKN